MGALQIRDIVHDYINQADDRFVQLVYGMIQADTSPDLLLTDAERKELDNRIARHKNGESKSYSWEEVKTQLQR